MLGFWGLGRELGFWGWGFQLMGFGAFWGSYYEQRRINLGKEMVQGGWVTHNLSIGADMD